ncbi:hypothetical protein F4818DRAFT_413840 [Hypoxylon cercidicola]|nr:hypothetical protein F4818DRAFT_413840 [Hypoxylon cercidicola]
MVGRRRRAPSNSTVATIDEAAIQFYKEESVLKPASAQVHTDDWPCFLLADATVYHQNGTLANLLHVDLEGPFITRGRLEVEKDQERYLVNRNMKDRSPWIQIQKTVSFSIGLKVDEPRMPVLWASGGAGWFEIIPSDAYKDMCDIMFQGICLHFAVLDRYEAALEKLHKKKKNANKTLGDTKLPLDTVLFNYAVSVGDGITLPEAHQRMRDHAIFLLSHFPKGTEFHSMLTNKFPDIAQRFSAKGSNTSETKKITESSSLVAVAYPSIEKSSSLEVVESKKKGRPSLRSSASRTMRTNEMIGADVVELSSDEPSRDGKASRTRRKSPFNLPSRTAHDADVTMLDVPADKHPNAALGSEETRSSVRMSIEGERLQPDPQATTSITKIHSDVSSSMSIVLEALQDARHDVLELVKEGKQKKHPDDMTPKTWFNKLYLELSIRNPKALSEVCEYFASDLVPLLGPEWHTSQFYKWLKENVNTKPKFEYIAEADMASIARRKKKQKTREEARDTTEDKEILPQPAVTQTAGKQPPRGRRSGKVAGLRPHTSSKKRMRHEAGFEGDEMDLDEDGMLKKTSKRSRYFAEDDDEEAHDTASSVSDEEEDEDKDAPLTRVVIRAEKLPSPTPKGLNQTWTCEEPDCGYVVRAADEEEGQALISEHYEAHEREAEEEMERDAENQTSLLSLAVQEAERGHLPVNHLLDKIRKLGDKTQRRDEVRLNGQVLPQPIKRNLLV